VYNSVAPHSIGSLGKFFVILMGSFANKKSLGIAVGVPELPTLVFIPFKKIIL
jgi:hypothetical protein